MQDNRENIGPNDQEDFLQFILSAPRNGVMGFVKGCSFGFALFGSLDMLHLIQFSEQNRFFYQGLTFGFALLGASWGLRNESDHVNIVINEHHANRLQRLGLFWDRAQAGRVPRTTAEGLAKGLLFSVLPMIFSEPVLSLKNAAKCVLAAMLAGGIWGFTNENRGPQPGRQ